MKKQVSKQAAVQESYTNKLGVGFGQSAIITPDLFIPTPSLPHCLLTVFVWGDRMCCAAPAYKPDNFSMPYLSPTAAKGILDRILFDKVTVDGKRFPAFRYAICRITAIEHPSKSALQGTTDTIMLNGVKNKITFKKGLKPYNFERRQRFITFVQYPAFRIDAYLMLLPIWELRQGNGERAKTITAYESMFKRSLAKHGAWDDVYLGLTMFPAHYQPYANERVLADVNHKLGPVIYDYLYDETTDRMLARRYMRVNVINGVMDLDWVHGDKQLVVEKEERKHV